MEFRKECKKNGTACASNGDSLITTKEIYGSQATVKLSTVDPVSAKEGVVVFKNGVQVPVMPSGVKGAGKYAEARNFKFTVDKLVPYETAEVQVVVTAENGKKTTYYLNIPSSLNTPRNMVLGRNSERNSIIVNYIPDSLDTRISGFVVVRAEYDKIDDDVHALEHVIAKTASTIASIFGKGSKKDEPKVQPNNKILVKSALIDENEATEGANVGINVGINEQKVIELIVENPHISAVEVSEKLSISLRQAERIFAHFEREEIDRTIWNKKKRILESKWCEELMTIKSQC